MQRAFREREADYDALHLNEKLRRKGLKHTCISFLSWGASGTFATRREKLRLIKSLVASALTIRYEMER